METPFLLGLVLVSGGIAVRAEYTGARRGVYIFKPLTTSLIILLALLQAPPVSPLYRALIAAGLVFSLAGDVFLMLPTDRFLAGLVSFLLAHLLYIAAFVSRTGFHVTPWLLVPFVAYGAVMLSLLWPHVHGTLRGPVLVYMAVILVMGWQAAEQWRELQSGSAALAAVGAVSFILSDSALALDRFRGGVPAARLVVLTTYWLAQWLIALSVGA